MNTANAKHKPVTIPFEIQATMMTYAGTLVSSTSIMLNVEVGHGRTVLTLVHNVPESDLKRLRDEGRVQRLVTIDASQENGDHGTVLKRVLIGTTEYCLTGV